MGNINDNLGNRMKGYEDVNRSHLTRRMPVIIRIDGKAFHTFTRGFKKPFDMVLMQSMWETCKYLCTNIQGCKIAYTQSDEISLLLTDYDTLTTSAWFDNNIQKMTSVSASMSTLAFNIIFSSQIKKLSDKKVRVPENYDLDKKYYDAINKSEGTAIFDSRVFSIPKEEVCNYFVWRQQDASRNSIQMVGRTYFSDKQLYKNSCDMIQEKLFSEKNINWNNLPTYQKRGACIYKELYNVDDKTVRSRYIVDRDIPIFTQDRNYIEKYL